jgi:hypothetical protein
MVSREWGYSFDSILFPPAQTPHHNIKALS